jgi:Rrf2 family protein
LTFPVNNEGVRAAVCGRAAGLRQMVRMRPITPRKNQYALRAVFELAKHREDGPVKISEIARAQAIPPRFLEVILSRLKRSGLIDSKRGFYGGYFLTRPPHAISVGDIMSFMQGERREGECAACRTRARCPFENRCAFSGMWNRVNSAIFEVYYDTSIQDLLDCDRSLKRRKGEKTRKTHVGSPGGTRTLS